MICPVSDGRRRGFRRSVAAAWRASGHQVFSEESELPERPVEGHHERRQKRQVIPATFCGIFFGIVGRQHGVGCHLRLARHSAWGCRAPGCGSRLAARRRRRGDRANLRRSDRGRRRGGSVRRFGSGLVAGKASSWWHAASVLPATARSKQPDRINPGYRFWHCHPRWPAGQVGQAVSHARAARGLAADRHGLPKGHGVSRARAARGLG